MWGTNNFVNIGFKYDLFHQVVKLKQLDNMCCVDEKWFYNKHNLINLSLIGNRVHAVCILFVTTVCSLCCKGDNSCKYTIIVDQDIRFRKNPPCFLCVFDCYFHFINKRRSTANIFTY